MTDERRSVRRARRRRACWPRRRRPGCIVRLIDAQAARGDGRRGADRRPGRGGGLPGGRGQPGPRRGRLVHGSDLWWGDERFLPAGRPGPQRDPGPRGAAGRAAARPGPGAPDAGLRRPGRRRPGGGGRPVRRGAGRARPRPGTARLPHFDVLLLGVGEDGHVASVFPEHPVAYETRPVSAVRGSPKPPPMRITLTLPTINTAEEVWLIAAGPTRPRRSGMALAGAGPVQLPAAGVRGRGAHPLAAGPSRAPVRRLPLRRHAHRTLRLTAARSGLSGLLAAR